MGLEWGRPEVTDGDLLENERQDSAMTLPTRQGFINLPARHAGMGAGPGHSDPKPSETAAPRNPNRIRVLLVEDDPGDAALLRIQLREQERPRFDVIHATSLSEARDKVETEAIDVVLLDLSLPDSTGVRTVAMMRATASSLPIVIMTGLLDPQVADKALEMGAQDYLIKGEDKGMSVTRAIRYAMARMAAQIERQFLIERLEQEQAATRHELDEARAMQFSILPRGSALENRLASMNVEIVSYFEPSFAVGGDLWGCMDYGQDRVAVYAFDFSGHGVSAALNVFRLHTLITEYGRPEDAPGTTLKKINRALVTSLKRGQYATIFLGIIDTQTDTLTWAASGYPRPILFTTDGGSQTLNSSGIPIGLVASASYENRQIPFPSGTSLFLHSDAMEEARTGESDMLGDEPLQSMIASHRRHDNSIDLDALLTQFFETVRTPVEDDLTALAIHRYPARQQAQSASLILLTDDPALRGQSRIDGIPVISPQDWTPGMGGTLTLGDASEDQIRAALRMPHGGLVETGGANPNAAIAACHDAIKAGGIALSLSTRTISQLDIATILSEVIQQRFPSAASLAPGAIDLCIAEAVGNAIIHGNLGIGGEERESSEGFLSFLDAINHRLENSNLANRQVRVTVTPSLTGHLEITISDEGAGFDLSAQLDGNAATEAKHGRGIALITKLAHSVRSQDEGRTLIITM